MNIYPDPILQLETWTAFVEQQHMSESLNPLIANSWRRCWGRLNPTQPANTSRLGQDVLLATQVSAFGLLSIARPIMEDIFQAVEQSETMVVLVNSAGYVLDIIGDADILDLLGGLGIVIGSDLSELRLGTNAVGLALNLRMPIQIVGAEHYLMDFHHLTDAANPIFDIGGRLMGALGIITTVGRHTAHTLGLVVAAARAIEAQHQADYLLAEQNSHLAELNAILAANPEGVMVWNAEHMLMRINESATRLLGLPSSVVVGRKIDDFLTYPVFFQEALEKRRPFNDVEMTFRVGENAVRCMVSLRFLSSRKADQWAIVSFKAERDVRQLIQHQMGTQAQFHLDDLPGESPEMRRVTRIVRSAANAQASILIRGESGTGKNLMANAIHNESLRCDGPFFIFPCSSIPNELVIGELLGSEQGFAGRRHGGRPSKFELAQGGTLYFQDVDALPLEGQSILLNALDMGIVQRLGSDHPLPIDVRIITSSSAQLEKLIAQGNFRADLFYRLSTFEITLPPLRERKEDLPLLVERILKRLSRQHNRPLELAPDVLDLFRKYSWPGNVRELEAVLGRAVLQAGFSEVISPMHIPEFIRYPRLEENGSGHAVVPQPLSQVERQAILEAAQACQGNLTETARLLGISRTTLWRKLKEFNISTQDFKPPANRTVTSRPDGL